MAWFNRFSTVSRSASASSISTTRRCSIGSLGPGRRRRPRTLAAPTRSHRPRGCWRGTCCRDPRPCCALDQSTDVDDLHRGVDELLRLAHRRQAIDPLVGHLGDADVGVLGGERVRRSERAATGEGVVQRALARVGEADQAEAFHTLREATAGIAACSAVAFSISRWVKHSTDRDENDSLDLARGDAVRGAGRGLSAAAKDRPIPDGCVEHTSFNGGVDYSGDYRYGIRDRLPPQRRRPFAVSNVGGSVAVRRRGRRVPDGIVHVQSRHPPHDPRSSTPVATTFPNDPTGRRRAYLTWKYGSTQDDLVAAGLWAVFHYYTQDTAVESVADRRRATRACARPDQRSVGSPGRRRHSTPPRRRGPTIRNAVHNRRRTGRRRQWRSPCHGRADTSWRSDGSRWRWRVLRSTTMQRWSS